MPNALYFIRILGYEQLKVVNDNTAVPSEMQDPIGIEEGFTCAMANTEFTFDLFPSGRGKVIFDSKAGLGHNESEIEFKGTSISGAIVEYRIRNIDSETTIGLE